MDETKNTHSYDDDNLDDFSEIEYLDFDAESIGKLSMEERKMLCPKPSWDEAPSWANYLVMDGDGEWIWFKNRPIAAEIKECWISKTDEGKLHKTSGVWGNVLLLDWRFSLIERNS